MFRQVAATLAWVTLCGLLSPAAAEEAPARREAPHVNPPRIVVASAIDADNQLVLVRYKRISDQDTPIIVSPYRTSLPDFYQKLFAPSTLHLVFPKQAPEWKSIQD